MSAHLRMCEDLGLTPGCAKRKAEKEKCLRQVHLVPPFTKLKSALCNGSAHSPAFLGLLGGGIAAYLLKAWVLLFGQSTLRVMDRTEGMMRSTLKTVSPAEEESLLQGESVQDASILPLP